MFMIQYKMENFKNIGIYTITNLVNNKIYVGSTTNSFNRRRNQHFSLLKQNKHTNSYLQNSYNKYGDKNFKFEVLEECSFEYCLSQEKYWINMLNTKSIIYGFNVIDPITNRLGFKYSEKSKLKMKASRLAFIKLNGTNKHSEESKKLISSSKKGLKMSDEICLKMSQRIKGKFKGSNNPFFGKKHSIETLKKMKINIDYTKKYKKVAKCSLSGEILEVFESRKSAIIANDNIRICSALKYPNRTSNGFKWIYITSEDYTRYLNK